jgi:DNA-binding beta-propeller fold protein YncE
MDRGALQSGLALALLLAFAACGEGRLILALDLPTDKGLDPTSDCRQGEQDCDRLEPRMARFALRITGPDGPRTQEALIGKSARFALGRAPLGGPFDLRLALQSSSGQVLGLGRVRNVEPSADDDTVVSVQLRKPIAYVTGLGQVEALDAAAARSSDVKLQPIAQGGVVAMTASPNGTLLLVGSSDRVRAYRTGDHRALIDIPLPSAPKCLAVTPDGRYLFICFADRLGIADLLQPEPVVATAGVGGGPLTISFAPDGQHAWLLVSGLRHTDSCSGAQNSTLVRVVYGRRNPQTGASFEPEIAVPLDFAAADLAVHPVSGALLVARPCGNDAEQGVYELPAREGGQSQLTQLVTIRRAYDINVTDDQIVVLASGEAAQLPVNAGQPSSSFFQVPPVTLSITGTSTPKGLFSWISQPENDLVVFDAEVSPDGQRALLLFTVTFRSDINTGGGCSYQTQMGASGYLVLDLISGNALFTRLTRLDFDQCSANCLSFNSQPMSTKSVCESAFREELRGQGVLSATNFEPRAAALLFGGR